MRTKIEIMELVVNKSKRATFPDEIKRIHSLYTLEMLIDIRDILNEMLIAKGESPLDTLLKS